jgi:hypothetical protein
VDAALAALNSLRPNPSQGEIEQLIPVGNSQYHGLTLELRHGRISAKNGAGFSFRAVYTLSFLKDDGIVNTSDALVAADFRREFTRSLLDRRHRFAFSGTFDLPTVLGKLRLSTVLRLASGAPFNLGLGGADRNLDDVGNDRPIFNGDIGLLKWREPGGPSDAGILNQFALPTIGQTGNLPRNAGLGPGQFVFDLNIAREFKVNERVRLRPTVEIDNVLNATVFSSGANSLTLVLSGPPRVRTLVSPSSIHFWSPRARCANADSDRPAFGFLSTRSVPPASAGGIKKLPERNRVACLTHPLTRMVLTPSPRRA